MPRVSNHEARMWLTSCTSWLFENLAALLVVPAKAGTHNHRPVLLTKASATAPQR